MKSPEQLAAAVIRTPAHDTAESELRDLRKRRKALREKISTFADVMGFTQEERRLYQEERKVEQEISAAARKLLPVRLVHGRRVAHALQVECLTAAGNALSAIGEAEAAMLRLNGLREQIRLAGGDTPSISPKALELVRLPLEGVIAKARKGDGK